jgi:subtilase family serine protease
VAAIGAAIALGCAGCAAVQQCAPPRTGNVSTTGEAVVRLPHDRPTGMELCTYHPTPEDKVIQLELEFAMRNQAEFNQLMQQIQAPGAPKHKEWLTPEQIHERFGETRAQFDDVKTWLQAQGFTIIGESYGGSSDYIRFKGTIGQIEKAFDIRIVSPEFDHYASMDDPAVPARFNGVIGSIDGLEVEGPLY